ncbi:MAG: hypothetical protein KC543_08665 [Myxococcales bacterium]|nr:hypothetical protein [Myxococcales bacterium]
MSTSTTLRIEPRDSLIVRDGRPNEGRSHSSTLSFPFPGTVAGMVRTRLGSEPGQGFVLDADGDALARLREVAIRGPLLVRGGDASPASADADPFGPVPADALLTEVRPGAVRLDALEPFEQPSETRVDARVPAGLSLVGPKENVPKGKPPKNAPTF